MWPKHIWVLMLYFSLLVPNDTAKAIELPPIQKHYVINGEPVTVTYLADVSPRWARGKVVLDWKVSADLSDVQKRLSSLLDPVLPNNNCRSFSGNNPVVSMHSGALINRQHSAVFVLDGRVVMWDCRENPNFKTKLVTWTGWCRVGRIKTKCPKSKIEKWRDSPIKTKTVSQTFNVEVPISLSIRGDQEVWPGFDGSKVKLRGKYAVVSNGVLRLADVDLGRELEKVLETIVRERSLYLALPEKIKKADLRIRAVSFSSRTGKLYANASGQVPVNFTSVKSALEYATSN